MRRAIAALVLMGSIIVLGTISASAQELLAEGAMRIEFRAIAGEGSLTPREFAGGRLAAFVGNTHCDTVIFHDAQADLLLGTANQPSACREPGARVSFMNIFGHQLWFTFPFSPGSIEQVVNFGPVPPGVPLPAHMQAVLESPDWPPRPAQVEVQSWDDGSRVYLESLQDLTVFVGETPCDVVDLAAGRQPIAALALLGLPKQQSECGAEDAPVTFLTAAGQQLVAEFPLRRTLHVLRGGDLERRSPAEPLPVYMQRFVDGGRRIPGAAAGPPSTERKTPTPARSGQGALEAESSEGALTVGVVVLVVVAALSAAMAPVSRTIRANARRSRLIGWLLVLPLLLIACTGDGAPPSSPPPGSGAPSPALATAPTPAAREDRASSPTPQPSAPVEEGRSGALLIDLQSGVIHRLLHDVSPNSPFGQFHADGESVWLYIPAERETVRFSLVGDEVERRPGYVVGAEAQRCRPVSQSPPRAEIDGQVFDVPCGIFSPDGSQMLFHRKLEPDGNRDLRYEVGVLDLASGEVTMLEDDWRHCGGCDGRAGPSWSPTGRYVLDPELGGVEGGSRTFLYDTAAGTSFLIALGRFSNAGYQLTWSPVEDAVLVPEDDGSTLLVRPATDERIPLPEVRWPARFDASGRFVAGAVVPSYSPQVREAGETVVADVSDGAVVARWEGVLIPIIHRREEIFVTVADGPAAVLYAAGCRGLMLRDPRLPDGERCLEGAVVSAFAPVGRLASVRRDERATAPQPWSVVLFDPATGDEKVLVDGIPGSDPSAPPVAQWSEDSKHLLITWPGPTGL
jgi:hypothetical protein